MKGIVLIIFLTLFISPVYSTPFDNATDKNISSVDKLIAHANDQTSPEEKHYYGDLMVFAIWVVTTGSAIGRFRGDKDGLLKSIMVGSFVSLIFAFMLNVINLVDEVAIGLPFALLIISILIHKLSEDY